MGGGPGPMLRSLFILIGTHPTKGTPGFWEPPAMCRTQKVQPSRSAKPSAQVANKKIVQTPDGATHTHTYIYIYAPICICVYIYVYVHVNARVCVC